MRGVSGPTTVLASVRGIGQRLAERLHNELGLETLEDLEAAAHDGGLATVAGFGDRRIAGIRESLALRLGRAVRSGQ
jgi:DNA polymerase (family X)